VGVMAHLAVEISNEFIDLAKGSGGLTQMQLQKLVFIANGFYAAFKGEPLVKDTFEAWDFGPVARDLREHTQYYGSRKITDPISRDDKDFSYLLTGKRNYEPYRANLDAAKKSIVEAVFSRYGDMDGSALSRLTHQPDTPWHKAYQKGRNTRISLDDVMSHYSHIIDNL
jgi:uncharacterized phage-associated protein